MKVMSTVQGSEALTVVMKVMSTVQGSEALTVTSCSLVPHPRSQISMQPHE